MFGSGPGLFAVVNKAGKRGFVNEAGKEIVACKYDEVGSFQNGYTVIKVKDGGEYSFKQGLMDSTGKEVIPMKYSQLDYYPKEKLLMVGLESSSAVGIIDVTGKVIIAPQYEFWSKRISNGLWPVGKKDICGVVNMKNEIIVPFIYQMIENYSDELGLAPAKKDGKFGFIDRTGKVVIPFMYNDAWASSTALIVKKDGKFGVISPANEIILPFEYSSISSVNDKTAWVAKTETEDLYEIDLKTKQKVGK